MKKNYQKQTVPAWTSEELVMPEAATVAMPRSAAQRGSRVASTRS